VRAQTSYLLSRCGERDAPSVLWRLSMLADMLDRFEDEWLALN
jgi:hypothetical protein